MVLILGSFAFFVQVIFVPPAPLHPHIYSNGHICLGLSQYLTLISSYLEIKSCVYFFVGESYKLRFSYQFKLLIVDFPLEYVNRMICRA